MRVCVLTFATRRCPVETPYRKQKCRNYAGQNSATASKLNGELR